jgi:hypothetical protein
MRILVWHVHGGWSDSFVRGAHEYLLPTTTERGAWGLGRGGRDWPDSAREVDPAALRDADVDLVVLQRPEEIAATERLLGRVPGRDLRALYVEHNTPKSSPADAVHPLADRDDIPIVHVSHFNELMWDSGRAPTRVIEHGVPDPGHLYTGELPNLGVVVNEPVRRGRVTGTDLLPRFAAEGHLDVFGMGTELLPAALHLPAGSLSILGDLSPTRLHARLARCRAYLHPMRWTSLGLALIEAMHLGMPVLALATTEAPRAVPPEAGAVSTRVDDLVAAARRLLDDADEARRCGEWARAFALEHYGLRAFLDHWDTLIHEGAGPRPVGAHGSAVARAGLSGRPARPEQPVRSILDRSPR